MEIKKIFGITQREEEETYRCTAKMTNKTKILMNKSKLKHTQGEPLIRSMPIN